MRERTRRQMPNIGELLALLRRKPGADTRRERSLARAANVEDLRLRGRRRTPRAAFDYVDGAAEDELSLSRSRQLYRDIEFIPNVLRDVSGCDPSTDILGAKAAFPFGFAPTGFTRMMHHEGERAVATVAAECAIPYALSTLGTTTPEALVQTVPGGDHWFQLYVWKDRRRSEALIDRVAACGFRTLILTVDLPVAGARLRDVRNGMTIPPNLTLRSIVDAGLHPTWWFNFLTTEPLAFATLESMNRAGATLVEMTSQLFDASLDFTDLAWLRSKWEGPIVVKGVQNVADARRCVDAGASGIILSNHGGRQLDRSPTPLRLVQPTVSELAGDAEVFVDGGIMNGGDIVAAVALGATAAFVGRAYLYGLMAGGEAGVRRAAQILTDDIVRTMKLLGVTSVSDLTPDHVRLPLR
ncbi:MAG: alpha-hydroxy-acid oxidizing protein [Acidimicrobiia bacterium]|nr:alpha-hydroxy-acid oxidizing protein [Acidimicrobiia bacterium]